MRWQIESQDMEPQHKDNYESSNDSVLLHLWGQMMSPNDRRKEKSKRKVRI